MTELADSAALGRPSRLTAAQIGAALAMVLLRAAQIALLLVIAFPVYWLIISSLKHQRDFFTFPPIFFPTDITLDHYRRVLADPFNRLAIMNTAIVASVSTVVATAVGTSAAYALARVRLPFRLNRVLLIWILINRLFPPVSLSIPYYLLIRDLGLLDTRIALVITYTSTSIPFVVWLMLTFFQDLPKEIERAAMVDGCSAWQRFFLVVLPMSTTSMVVTSVFVFISAWNEFLFALTLTSLRSRTISVAISNFLGDSAVAWGQMSAFSVISFIPVLLMTLCVQRYLVRGVTMGAVKG
jgi:multiple sugar transport system permease protein